ncbi:tyrosine-type recombinase/integrase [Sphaerisporangium sp. NPDC088356]|uniref:tyrosine-type recombinase/integrase n=1 Tax=Sphaerisporangium sp. NPDC088356 TaxID=3154871 RepID=UPI00343F0C6C
MITGRAAGLPFCVVDADGEELEPVSAYLRYLMLGNASPLTCRSYAFGLLRWYRLLWCLEIGWEKATQAEVATLVGWLQVARHPQGERKRPEPAPVGSVNLKPGKPSSRVGYAPRTINHALTVVHGFYSFHCRSGNGPVTNPVPDSAQRWQVLAHDHSLEPVPIVQRAPLRHQVAGRAPRPIPDTLWDELFAAMGGDRDRALLAFYVSTGARVSELLTLTLEDIDWGGQLIYVVPMRTRLRQPIPASPDAFRYLGRYLASDGLPAPGQPIWRSHRGESRPMTYWAIQRVLQRANERLGTDWTWHDAHHTALTRMADGERLTPAEVRTIAARAPEEDRASKVETVYVFLRGSGCRVIYEGPPQ